MKGRVQPNLGNEEQYKTPGPEQLPIPKPTPSQLQERATEVEAAGGGLAVKKTLTQSPHMDHGWERELLNQTMRG